MEKETPTDFTVISAETTLFRTRLWVITVTSTELVFIVRVLTML